jgi:TPR repeat protein
MKTRWKQFLLAFTFVSAAIPLFSQSKGIDPALLGKATAGDAESECRVGQMYAKGDRVGQDFTQAAAWYSKAADQGLAQAQYELGLLAQSGQGVPQSDAQAAAWFRKAAEQGLAAAELSLGGLYDHGQGVAQDYAQAALWYNKAADQGLARAQYNLGSLFAQGQGVPQSYTEAYFWLSLAASTWNGVRQQQAAQARDTVAARLSPAELFNAQQRAQTWLNAHQK